MKTLLTWLLVAFAANLVAQESPKPLSHVNEGIYFAHDGYFTNILELKDGRFRNWRHAPRGGEVPIDPDTLLPVRPRGPRYTLDSGHYTTNGGTITFTFSAAPVITNQFTFMEYKGKVTLWSEGAQKFWNRNPNRRLLLPSGILEATDRKPEDILEGK